MWLLNATFWRNFWKSLLDVTFERLFCHYWRSPMNVPFWQNFWTYIWLSHLDVTFRHHVWMSLFFYFGLEFWKTLMEFSFRISFLMYNYVCQLLNVTFGCKFLSELFTCVYVEGSRGLDPGGAGRHERQTTRRGTLWLIDRIDLEANSVIIRRKSLSGGPSEFQRPHRISSYAIVFFLL